MIYALGKTKEVNIGQVIFENLVSLVDSKNAKQAIGNPSVLYELVMSQAPYIKIAADRLSAGVKKFGADHKLFINWISLD